MRIASDKAHSGKVRGVTPGVFHHLDEFDACVLHHGPVHLDQPLGGQGMHLTFVDGMVICLLSSSQASDAVAFPHRHALERGMSVSPNVLASVRLAQRAPLPFFVYRFDAS